ncbi:MAG: RES family NAD+ phosphorylase [Dyadobacter sp.]|uniref:RES family NAD+ phosphorylase n=1 Tax=Dyadobacter sp. TaxID=1914288 RepID=UPI001B09EB59|nr:RES family NAD+ phosphorylase [Dyadobacter sp.]MBO9612762.1 RES family NAD+ phosphorylase [Dyadobacter sp.]
MELFRITRSEYQDDLSGIGAFYNGGRWNTPRNAMLYTSSHRSLAMLEVLVHWHKTVTPPNYVIVSLEIPDDIASVTEPSLVPEWPEDEQWSKGVGDSWLKAGNSLLLRVPSVVVKAEQNYLVNPMHPDVVSLRITDIEPLNFDKRLFKKI